MAKSETCYFIDEQNVDPLTDKRCPVRYKEQGYNLLVHDPNRITAKIAIVRPSTFSSDFSDPVHMIEDIAAHGLSVRGEANNKWARYPFNDIFRFGVARRWSHVKYALYEVDTDFTYADSADMVRRAAMVRDIDVQKKNYNGYQFRRLLENKYMLDDPVLRWDVTMLGLFGDEMCKRHADRIAVIEARDTVKVLGVEAGKNTVMGITFGMNVLLSEGLGQQAAQANVPLVYSVRNGAKKQYAVIESEQQRADAVKPRVTVSRIMDADGFVNLVQLNAFNRNKRIYYTTDQMKDVASFLNEQKEILYSKNADVYRYHSYKSPLRGHRA